MADVAYDLDVFMHYCTCINLTDSFFIPSLSLSLSHTMTLHALALSASSLGLDDCCSFAKLSPKMMISVLLLVLNPILRLAPPEFGSG